MIDYNIERSRVEYFKDKSDYSSVVYPRINSSYNPNRFNSSIRKRNLNKRPKTSKQLNILNNIRTIENSQVNHYIDPQQKSILNENSFPKQSILKNSNAFKQKKMVQKNIKFDLEKNMSEDSNFNIFPSVAQNKQRIRSSNIINLKDHISNQLKKKSSYFMPNQPINTIDNLLMAYKQEVVNDTDILKKDLTSLNSNQADFSQWTMTPKPNFIKKNKENINQIGINKENAEKRKTKLEFNSNDSIQIYGNKKITLTNKSNFKGFLLKKRIHSTNSNFNDYF